MALVKIRDLKNPPSVTPSSLNKEVTTEYSTKEYVSSHINDDLIEVLEQATAKVNKLPTSTPSSDIIQPATRSTQLSIPVPSTEIAKYVNMSAIQVGQFGSDAVTSVAKCGDDVTAQIKMSDMPDFQEKVVNILTVAKSVRVPNNNEKQSRWKKFVNKGKYSREKLISDFSTVEQQINGMLTVVEDRQTVLATANERLDIAYDNNISEYEKLTDYIEIGEKLITFKNQELIVLQSIEPIDMLQAQKINDMIALIKRLEERVNNLRKFQMVAIQTAPMIRAMQSTNLTLIDKFVDLKTMTIPSWKKQFNLQITAQDQAKANVLANTIDDATNEFMLENSKLLCDTAVAVASSNQRGPIYIETLEGVQNNLVTMFADIKQINEDGDTARKDAYDRMEEMKKVYLQIAKDGLS